MVWSCESVKVKEVDAEVANVENRKLIIEVSKYDVVERDQEVLKKIKWGIKHNYSVVRMNTDEARKAMGEA